MKKLLIIGMLVAAFTWSDFVLAATPEKGTPGTPGDANEARKSGTCSKPIPEDDHVTTDIRNLIGRIRDGYNKATSGAMLRSLYKDDVAENFDHDRYDLVAQHLKGKKMYIELAEKDFAGWEKHHMGEVTSLRGTPVEVLAFESHKGNKNRVCTKVKYPFTFIPNTGPLKGQEQTTWVTAMFAFDRKTETDPFLMIYAMIAAFSYEGGGGMGTGSQK